MSALNDEAEIERAFPHVGLGPGIAVFPSSNGYWCPVSAAHDPEQALAKVPCQDADCERLIGVNVYGSGARLVITVAR
jgi:hypothetical protein